MTYPAMNARAELLEHLEARFHELELTILNRIRAISPSLGDQDPVYRHGLQAAVPVAIRYGLDAMALGDTPPVPTELLSQARLDARYEVSLSEVLRRYVAGRSLFDDFVLEEIEKDPRVARRGSKDLLRAQAMLFEHLVGAIADEYGRETKTYFRPDPTKGLDGIRRLLDGELLDTSRLEYDFGTLHVGLIAEGKEATKSVRTLAGAIDARLLLAEPHEDHIWAWIGVRRPLAGNELARCVAEHWPEHLRLASGEIGRGINGWRLTHEQAKAAFAHSLQGPVTVARYADIALDVSVAQDHLLTASLRAIYLAPLEQQRDRGEALRATLSAYFAADRNRASTAAALGVSRQTVANRLKTVEEVINSSIAERAADLELALRVQPPYWG
jgi:hypothetical protein